MHRAIAKIDPQFALDDEERLIGLLVIMPDEVALQLHDFELVVVHFGDDLRLPLLVEQGELLAQVDRLVGHGASPSRARFPNDMRQIENRERRPSYHSSVPPGAACNRRRWDRRTSCL